ncbi:MAG: hypothetical protein ACO3UU_09180, partial [Minisyncoccia bacterium]
LNPNNVTKIPSLTNNANYILRKASKENWYRKASGNNSSDTTVNWENPIDLYFNVASNPLNPALTSGTATNVLTVGIHTITSASPLKNSNTISLPDRGGLVNNSSVVYNTTVSPIGNLTANNSYKIKTEDVSLSSDSFRLSSYNESVKLYGFSYSAGTSVATIYVYDTEDRASSSLDGLNSAGIISGNTIQISGSEYPNPIKKQSINRRFNITSTPTVYTSITKDPSSPVGTRKYIYNFTVAIPQDGSFNTDTAISIFAGQTYADSALGNTKCTAITNLDISNPATTGEHTLTQNIDGAVDDIYQTVNTSSDTFQFRTLVEIPEITKNIANFSSSAEAPITLTNSPAYFSVTNNGTVNLQAAPAFANSFIYKSTISNVTYTAPISIEFRFINATSYQFSVGLTEFNSSSLRYTNGYTWVQDTYSSGTSFAYGTGAGTLYSDRAFDPTYVYKIEYNADGNIRWYKNGSLVASTNAGTGKSFRVYVSYYDYSLYTSSGMNVNNLKIASSSLPFTPGSTDYLKVASHNFADGTEVVYQTSGAESILPLVNNQQYYVRVLDGDYIGLTNSFETAIDSRYPNLKIA